MGMTARWYRCLNESFFVETNIVITIIDTMVELVLSTSIRRVDMEGVCVWCDELRKDPHNLTWEQILEPKGWKKLSESNGVIHWLRPGKESTRYSAISGQFRTADGQELITVFSRNAPPFQWKIPYTKSQAYRLLHVDPDSDLDKPGYSARAELSRLEAEVHKLFEEVDPWAAHR
jgi:hypothetical protein